MEAKYCCIIIVILMLGINGGMGATILSNSTETQPCLTNTSQKCSYNVLTIQLEGGGSINLGSFILRNVAQYNAYFPQSVKQCGYCMSNEETFAQCSCGSTPSCGGNTAGNCPYNKNNIENNNENMICLTAALNWANSTQNITNFTADSCTQPSLFPIPNWCYSITLKKPAFTAMTNFSSNPTPLFALGSSLFPISQINATVQMFNNASIMITNYTDNTSPSIQSQDYSPHYNGFYNSEGLDPLCTPAYPVPYTGNCEHNRLLFTNVNCTPGAPGTIPGAWLMEPASWTLQIYLYNNTETVWSNTAPSALWANPLQIPIGNFMVFECCARVWTSLVSFPNGSVSISGQFNGEHCVMSNTPSTSSNGCSCVLLNNGILGGCPGYWASIAKGGNFEQYVVATASQQFFIRLTLPINSEANNTANTNPGLNVVMVGNTGMIITCTKSFICSMNDGPNTTSFQCSSIPYSYNFENNDPFYSVQCGAFYQSIANPAYNPENYINPQNEEGVNNPGYLGAQTNNQMYSTWVFITCGIGICLVAMCFTKCLGCCHNWVQTKFKKKDPFDSQGNQLLLQMTPTEKFQQSSNINLEIPRASRNSNNGNIPPKSSEIKTQLIPVY
jgi:hypothetical protein